MPALPDRSGRDAAGRGRRRRHRWRIRRASTRPASWHGAASRSRCSRRDTLGWGASTRNGGIVHAGYKWSARQLIKRYGDDDRQGALPGDARLVRARQAPDRRRSHRLRLPRGRPPRARLRAVARRRARARTRRASRRSASSVDGRAARADPRGDRQRRLLRRAGRRGQRPAPSRPVLRGSRRGRRRAPAPTCTRASGRRSIRRQADGRFVVETARGAILARDVFVATNGYTDGVVPVAPPADHPDRVATSSRRSRCPRTSPTSSRRRAAPSSTRRTSCTTGTCRPTAG